MKNLRGWKMWAFVGLSGVLVAVVLLFQAQDVQPGAPEVCEEPCLEEEDELRLERCIEALRHPGFGAGRVTREEARAACMEPRVGEKPEEIEDRAEPTLAETTLAEPGTAAGLPLQEEETVAEEIAVFELPAIGDDSGPAEAPAAESASLALPETASAEGGADAVTTGDASPTVDSERPPIAAPEGAETEASEATGQHETGKLAPSPAAELLLQAEESVTEEAVLERPASSGEPSPGEALASEPATPATAESAAEEALVAERLDAELEAARLADGTIGPGAARLPSPAVARRRLPVRLVAPAPQGAEPVDRRVLGYRAPLVVRQPVPDRIAGGVYMPAHEAYVVLRPGRYEVVPHVEEVLEPAPPEAPPARPGFWRRLFGKKGAADGGS